MAKEQVKLTKVKITNSVAWRGKILAKGSVAEVSAEDAEFLIDNKHATDNVAPKADAPGDKK